MIPGHPHTVASHPVPLYMRGYPAFLGQDDGTPIDPTMYDFGTTLTPPDTSSPIGDVFLPQPSDFPIEPTSELPIGGTLIAPAGVDPQTAALAQLYQSAVASGTMTQAQAAAALAASASSVAKAATGIATAPSPRVATRAVPSSLTSLLSSQSIIKGVPDILILGGGLLAIAAIGRR